MGWLLYALLVVSGPGSYPERTSVRCRYECVCFRVNGYRCLRAYTETCGAGTCWQCQERVTRKARQSCSIGARIKSCFCKYTKLDHHQSRPPELFLFPRARAAPRSGGKACTISP